MISVAQIPVKTFLSKSKIPGFDYVINPYVGCPHKCVYCYAEYMRKFSGHEENWGDFLDVRYCSVPLKPSVLFRTHILLSSVTDPYNPYEQQYKVTRQLLKQLQLCQAYVHILTKSTLVTRDIDLLQQLPQCDVTFSFSSADDAVRQLMEPGASPVEEKIKALQVLHDHHIQTAVMIAPILPGITDWKEIITHTRAYTDRYTFDSLNMRKGFQRKVLKCIETHYPKLLPLYVDIYLHENQTYWINLAQEIRAYATAENLKADIVFPHPPRRPARQENLLFEL